MTQEITIHQSLNHKNVVGFHGFFDDTHNIYIILELCRKRVSENLYYFILAAFLVLSFPSAQFS